MCVCVYVQTGKYNKLFYAGKNELEEEWLRIAKQSLFFDDDDDYDDYDAHTELILGCVVRFYYGKAFYTVGHSYTQIHMNGVYTILYVYTWI